MENKSDISNKNLFLAIALSVIVILGWSYLFPNESEKSSKSLEKNSDITKEASYDNTQEAQSVNSSTSLEQINQSQGQDVTLQNENISVIINTKGLKVGSINVLKDNFNSHLFASELFAQVGFLSQTNSVPNQNTVWNLVSQTASSAIFKTVIAEVEFTQTISFRENYLLEYETKVKNNSANPLVFQSFSRINQNLTQMPEKNAISHEGPIAYINGNLQEKSYHKFKKQDFNFDSTDGKPTWFGISDKYTIVSFITKKTEKVDFTHPRNYEKQIYQVSSSNQNISLTQGQETNFSSQLYIGNKKLKTLEEIAKKYNAPHFDKAIDFGFLYFITKPIFLLLNFIYLHVGSFAIAIVILTLLLKIVFLPLTIKSSISMAKMKNLQPEIKRIQEQYKNDKKALGQATIRLYNERKINPLAGCLPMLVQIPIFFALYKVLYVSTEMKNAHLFFWIKDLSSPDPTSIINIFGLLPFNVPPFLGVLPIVFGISMYLYQKVSPQPTDATQAKIMQFLPVIMTIFLSGFAAGLLFYWIVNNLISAAQQFILEKFVLPKHHGKHSRKK